MPSLRAQQSLINYTVEDGLPSPETYSLYQDIDGYIWVCTDRGLARYNGYEFEAFSTSDGITYNTIFKVMEDRSHNLYFNCFDRSITYYDYRTKKFSSFWANDYIKNNLGSETWISCIGLRQDSLFIHFSTSLPYYSKKYLIISLSDSSISEHLIVSDKLYTYENLLFLSKEYKTDSRYHRAQFVIKAANKGNQNFKQKEWEDLRTSSIYTYLSSQEMLQVSRKGIKIVTKHDTTFIPLKGATSAMKDREGNYWFTTENRGVFKMSSSNFSCYESNRFLRVGDQMTAINSMGNYVFLGTKGSMIYAYNTANNKISKVGSVGKNEGVEVKVNSFIKRDDRLFTELGYEVIPAAKSHRLSLTNYYGYLDALEYGDGNIVGYDYTSDIFFFDRWNGLSRTDKSLINNKCKLSLSEKEHYGYGVRKRIENKTRILSMNATNEKTVYFSMYHELKQIDTNDTVTNLTDKYDLGKTTARKIICKSDTIILGTSGMGIVFINGGKKWSISEKDGLSSDIVNDIIWGSDSSIWCATNKGISHIKFSHKEGLYATDKVENYSTENGLGATYVSKLHLHKGVIYGLSEKGLVHFPETIELAEAPLPKVHLLSLKQGGAELPFKQQRFSYDQNDIEITYLGISLRKPIGRPFYKYMLIKDGELKDWIYTNNRSLTFDQLQAGEYSFLISACNDNNLWAKPKACSFTVRPHWTALWWVRGLAGIVLAIILFYLYLRDRKKRNKQYQEQLAVSELREKLNATELAVLRGQMNPHFIYNSLNSVQKFLIQDNKLEANEFISRLAKLLRAGLEYSREDYIPLPKEIEFIENYMKIETQRFPNRFQYKVEVDDQLDENASLPPLMVQGLCENAIKHAYNGKKVHISIQFIYHSEDLIRIVVQDDGAGILNKKKTASNIKSLGNNILSKRIDIFKERNSLASFEVQALNKETKEGTIAELILPII